MTAVLERDDVEPVANETRDRIITGTVTVLPFFAVGAAGVLAWQRFLHWSDVIVFVIGYVLTGLGVTLGFHRHLTHRAFKAKKWVRATLAALGSAAIEGPVIAWVADHRKHHAFTDVEGDPHSPHVDHGHGWRGALKGLMHAHVGWLFLHTQRGKKDRYAPRPDRGPDDPLHRPHVRAVGGDRAGDAVRARRRDRRLDLTGLTGMLWGGLVRVFLLHHVTYSINSLCHFFGRKRFETGDESRNLLWLAPLSFGESWHNNHHAFPTSARHGLAAGSSTSPPA